jgi:hypothetical protein
VRDRLHRAQLTREEDEAESGVHESIVVIERRRTSAKCRQVQPASDHHHDRSDPFPSLGGFRVDEEGDKEDGESFGALCEGCRGALKEKSELSFPPEETLAEERALLTRKRP